MTSFEDLVLFIRNEISEFQKQITREKLIEDDLGVTGDEADELIISFSQSFFVDIIDFNFSKYFYSEPPSFFDTEKRHRLTIGDLEKAIELKKLT